MIVDNEQIENLHITEDTCIKWVKSAFGIKKRCQLPPKISVHPQGDDFITTMPCLLPQEYGVFGVKVVSRIAGRFPALKSDLMLFDSKSGEIKAVMDADWITTMRTGAVAALAVKTFRKTSATNYAMIGLGKIGHAVMKCLSEIFKDEHLNIRLFHYKEQAENFMDDFSYLPNVSFTIVDTISALVENTDVLISCVTVANELFVKDVKSFAPGILIVPVHTRGFQNCDLCFDKIFADDIDHVRGFKYFNQFRYLDEIGNVLHNGAVGRENDEERILSYNIGLGLHDVYYAYQICRLMKLI